MLKTKPCPFCGSKSIGGVHDIVERFPTGRMFPHFNVHCYDCGCSGPVSENKEGAIKYWNEQVQEMDRRNIYSLLFEIRNQVLLQVRNALRTRYSADREELYLAINKGYDLTGDTVLLISELLLKLRARR